MLLLTFQILFLYKRRKCIHFQKLKEIEKGKGWGKGERERKMGGLKKEKGEVKKKTRMQSSADKERLDRKFMFQPNRNSIPFFGVLEMIIRNPKVSFNGFSLRTLLPIAHQSHCCHCDVVTRGLLCHGRKKVKKGKEPDLRAHKKPWGKNTIG